MTFQIIKTYRESVDNACFIGKVYSNADRIDGHFGHQWDLWHQEKWFDTLANLSPINDDYYGLMTVNDHTFSYWIGQFFPLHTPIPDGFTGFDLPHGAFGISWIYGMDDIYGEKPHNAALNAVLDLGWTLKPIDLNGQTMHLFFEAYNCPRFTQPDEKGNVILDYGFFLEDNQ